VEAANRNEHFPKKRSPAEIGIDELQPVSGLFPGGGILPGIDETAVKFHDEIDVAFLESNDQIGQAGIGRNALGESVDGDGDLRGPRGLSMAFRM
jgi:hypothetical protein